ncbi:MAG TPA: cytochrome C oxidase subunit IV family protein [Ginsengibacter sp.]|nr:cytochrome C oxidase subunit IV family protein [Chitinophagaceae bacterium]HRN71766.1 cytochrome C oxidase subunit IV family protein [Ginsengibacter sp.]HRP16462.1 cytochrome C oxidase subunit IV family protein [Ginsengibacter sp.]HRP43964.1 cytochrome C oxidase subunit IV family protein [Ginsengibacter sp.]
MDTVAHVMTPEQDSAQVKRIWKAFWVLLVLTILELALGLTIYFLEKGEPSAFGILSIKIVIIIFTIAKAFYIISIFMHLGDERRNMIMSIGIPALLFIWFIIAFLTEGNSIRYYRNTDAKTIKYEQQHIRHQPLNIPPGAENKYKVNH